MQEPLPVLKVFYGQQYEIGLLADGSFVLDEHIGYEEFFDSFDDLVAEHPYAAEAKPFFLD